MQPSKFGPRVVKGRTPLQQAHAADYKTRPESVLNLLPRECGLPSDSWWATPCTRAEFDARVMHEQPRIASSRFARLSGTSLATT
jgi:hypothetical protein